MKKNKQIMEAQARMETLVKVLGANPNLSKYLKQGKVYYSYLVSGLWGCIDTINYDPNYVSIIKEFEEEYKAYVYHAIETETHYGKLLTLLYVSSHEEDWEYERLVYDDEPEHFKSIYGQTYNITHGFSEGGSFYVYSDNGALVPGDSPYIRPNIRIITCDMQHRINYEGFCFYTETFIQYILRE